MLQVVNFFSFRSNLAMAPWYIMPSHILPSLSGRRPSMPVGQPFLSSGSCHSLCWPVFGSIMPKVCSPKLGVIGVAVGADDDVMRFGGRARQVVFRIDDFGGAAFGTRQRL